MVPTSMFKLIKLNTNTLAYFCVALVTHKKVLRDQRLRVFDFILWHEQPTTMLV
jgi:hypothetical protein